MYVKFRVDYRPGEANARELSIVLKPEGSRPNPVAPGQVVKFMVSQEALQRGAEQFQLKRNFGLADLPHDQVWLCVYGSGGRLIKKINSQKFGYHFFSGFDKLRKKNDSTYTPIQEERSFSSVNINPYGWSG
jgi:hypothetical protein